MLQPKRTKYRRPQKGRCKGNAMRGNQLAFGSFGIKSLETHWITARQIEAARVAMTRYMQREGQSWIRISPTSQSPRNLPMSVWVRVRVIPLDTCSPSLPDASSLRLKAFLTKLPRKHFVWHLRSCLLPRSSLLDVITTKTHNYEDCRN